MISFKILTDESRDEILDSVFESIPDADRVFASDNLSLLLENEDEDIEYAVTSAHGCLLIRVYDEEYCFIYPLPLCEGADKLAAAMEIRAYTVKEEIPLVYIDVRAEDVGGLVTRFRHVNIDTADKNNRFFTIRVMSELMLLDEQPSYIGFHNISLEPLTEEDDEDYFRLCSDKESNQFWGYDYSQDEPDPDISYFRQVSEGEFNRGAALSLAVRAKGVFVGEATLYYFDLMGGCECAVRILPEHRRRGYGVEALKTLNTVARRMGLTHLKASVDINNSASIAMTEKFFPRVEEIDGQVHFDRKV